MWILKPPIAGGILTDELGCYNAKDLVAFEGLDGDGVKIAAEISPGFFAAGDGFLGGNYTGQQEQAAGRP